LGKELIAIGIKALGDSPIGWRFMSTVFGALTVTGTYIAALALFRTQLSAMTVALLTGTNHLVYVQSRIAMLDTFLAGFLVWSIALGLIAFFPLFSLCKSKWALYGSGVLLGLALSCKWIAIIPWGMLIILGALPNSRAEFGGITIFLAWILTPLLTYYLSFLPFLWIPKTDGSMFSVYDILIQMQYKMWDGQLRVGTSHPYSSHWYQWPLMNRPIWYSFEPSDDKRWVRGVLLIGNPVVLWGGLAALGWTLRDAFRCRSFSALWIIGAYLALTLCWVLIPRKIAFFYYYYPSAIMLSFAWAYFLKERSLSIHAFIVATSVAFFIYFFPILAGLKIPFNDYLRWMWFQSWI